MTQKHMFFLGGRDLEMVTIGELLAAHRPGQFIDKGLCWGAKASDYGKEIGEAVADGLVPVLVELELDRELPDGVVIIDHHGERAGAQMPTALDQIFDFLGLARDEDWTRWFELVAANDKGHITGMQAVGATPKEIEKVRQAEWRALGIDEQAEGEVRSALQNDRQRQGRLTLVTIANNASSVVTDLLHEAMGGAGFDNLLVIQPQKLAFYGAGEVIAQLARTYPACWYGGALNKNGDTITGGHGYWGIEEADRDKKQTIIRHIKSLAR